MSSAIEGADQLQIKFDKLLTGVSDTMVKKALDGLGSDIRTRDMPEGFRQDLGADLGMSNWPNREKGPMPLAVRANTSTPRQLVIGPDGRSAGPLSMLERGRTPRRAGQFRSRGTRTRKKDGATYTRLVQVSRTVGPMTPLKTWSDGAEIVQRRLPERLESWLRAVRRQAFGGS